MESSQDVTTGPRDPGWRSWQSDAGLWWATRQGRWQQPMTVGPARDRTELAGIVEQEAGQRAMPEAGRL